MPAFRETPDITRQITFGDLLFACAITFGFAPALSFGVGYGLTLALQSTGERLNVILPGLLVAFGYTGLYAWAGIPIALLAGWWATRKGWLGWASGIGLGALGGAVFAMPFIGGTDVRLIGIEVLSFVGLFAALGALYGLIGYHALRWMRADLLSPKHREKT